MTYRGTTGRLIRDQRFGTTGDFDVQCVKFGSEYGYQIESGGIRTFHLSDPATTVGEVAGTNISANFIGDDVATHTTDDFVVTSTDSWLEKFEFTDPANPSNVYSIDLSTDITGSVGGVFESSSDVVSVIDEGGRSGDGSVLVYDVSDPSNISLSATITTELTDPINNDASNGIPAIGFEAKWATEDVVGFGTSAEGSNKALFLINVTDPTSPTLFDVTRGDSEGYTQGIETFDEGRTVLRLFRTSSNRIYLESWESVPNATIGDGESYYKRTDIVDTGMAGSASRFRQGLDYADGRLAFSSVSGFSVGRANPKLIGGIFTDRYGNNDADTTDVAIYDGKLYGWVPFGASPGLQVFNIED